MTAGTSSTATAAELGLLLEDIRWVRDRPRWVAELSDGLVVYMDDGRTRVRPSSAWVRLKEYCRRTGAHIVGLRVQFGPNVRWLPAGKAGYFFARGAFGSWGDPGSHDAFVVGFLEDGKVVTRRFKVPEMEPLELRTRDPDPDSPCLICRHD